MSERNRDREDAYEALMDTAVRKYDGPIGRYGPTMDAERGLREWVDTLPPPRRMKGVDLWWEYDQLVGHTDREYGSFAYGPVCDRLGALEEEVKRRACANDHLFGTGELPNGDLHICPDADDGPCTSPYCDDDPDAWATPEQQKVVAEVLANVIMFPGKVG
jgi:hypothetical protein